MRHITMVVCLLLWHFTIFAAEETIVGWRGNWTGKFPDANPPIKWSKLSKVMKGLRCQAEKPKDDKPSGVSASLGSLTEWLVLGPFPAAEDKEKAAEAKKDAAENKKRSSAERKKANEKRYLWTVEEEFIKDEANCRPEEGGVVKGVRWKKVEVVGSMVNFNSIFAKDMPDGTPIYWPADARPRVSRLPTVGTGEVKNRPPFFGKPFVAYAHTYVYSPMAATLRFRLRSCMIAKVYVNGKLIQGLRFSAYARDVTVGEFSVKLNQGWNRVLCKVRNRIISKKAYRDFRTWYFDLGVRAAQPYKTESEGIAWAALLPSYHIANPLIVGDKIFAMSKPGDLICLRKKDGKVLWIGSTTYYDLLSDRDKRDNPALAEAAAKVAPLVKQIKKIHVEYVKKGQLSVESMNTRLNMHAQIVRLMGKADKKKYGGNVGHYPAANMPTPVSDGKHVYVWSELGIAVCYDLGGQRKWLSMSSIRHDARHASPTFVGGKMIIVEGNAHTGPRLFALDMHTGDVAWDLSVKQTKPKIDIGGLSLPSVKIGGDDYVFYQKYLVRGRDGKMITPELKSIRGLFGNIITSVIENGTVYGAPWTGDRVFKVKLKLPTDPGKMAMSAEVITFGAQENLVASPLCHEGLLYVINQRGTLSVIDTRTNKLVYQQYLGPGKDWPHKFYHNPNWGWAATYASPMLAGKYIYVFATNGTTVVFKPGRKYQEVARNKIEDVLLATNYGDQTGGYGSSKIPESFIASPVAERERIYVRGSNYLYCIGEKSGEQR